MAQTYPRDYVEVPQALTDAIIDNELGVKPNGLHIVMAKVKVWLTFTPNQKWPKADVQFEFTNRRKPGQAPQSFRKTYFGPDPKKENPDGPPQEWWLRDQFMQCIHNQTCFVFFDPDDIVATVSSKNGQTYCEIGRDNQIMVNPPGTPWMVDLATGVGAPDLTRKEELPLPPVPDDFDIPMD